MPDGTNAAAWQAAGNSVTQLANTISIQKSDGRSRRFQREIYDKTKADNLDFWHLQNAYNSPEQQMNRFRDAGLNPNLIYGNSGDNSAGNIPTPDVVAPQFRAPQMQRPDLLSSMLAHADLRIKSAQANNLNEQTEVIRKDAILRDWQARRAGFDYKFAEEFRGVQGDALTEAVRQKRIASDIAINRDARDAISQAVSVSEAAERILNLIETRKGFAIDRNHTAADTERIRENIVQMQKDGTLKDFEIKLNESNITKSDPMWQRMIADFLSGRSGLLQRGAKAIPPEAKMLGRFRRE